jgi:transposase-like protein
MLKSTIKGIQESYRHFLDNAGIMPHEIIMTVIFDGIEKINNSKDQTENMISYFNEIDLKNGFRHKQYGKTLEEYLRELEQRNFNFSMLGDDKMDNVSLFTED